MRALRVAPPVPDVRCSWMSDRWRTGAVERAAGDVRRQVLTLLARLIARGVVAEDDPAGPGTDRGWPVAAECGFAGAGVAVVFGEDRRRRIGPGTRMCMCASPPRARWGRTPSGWRASTSCGNGRSRWAGRRIRCVVIDADLGRSGADATARLGFKRAGRRGRAGPGRDRPGDRGVPAGPQQRRLVSAAGPVRADRHADRRRRRRLPPGDFNDRLVLGLKGTMSRGRAAPDPLAADRRAAAQGRPRASCGSDCRSGWTTTTTTG